MADFWLCFVPLFVAVDPLGVLPMFVAITHDLEPGKVRRIACESVATAGAVALTFLAVGKAVLGLLGITVADFMIAGGILLFVISVGDLLSAEKSQRQVDPDSLGIVPLGVPLIAGPAVLTASVLLLNQHGLVPTAAAIVANLLIAGAVLWFSGHILRILGRVGAKVISKVTSLLLAAIAVMLVRKGITMVVTG